MGVRGTRRLEQWLPHDGSDEDLQFVSVNHLLTIADEKDLYDGDRLDIKGLLSLRKDLDVKYENLDASVSGKLFREGSRWIISINKNHHVNRQRFTLAHELAHYVLHRSDSDSFTDTVFFRGASSDGMEFAANAFAAELLMPEDRVRKAIRDGKLRDVGKLAEHFGVSAVAMLYRIKQLGFRTA